MARSRRGAKHSNRKSSKHANHNCATSTDAKAPVKTEGLGLTLIEGVPRVKKPLVMLLAGGGGTRLGVLVQGRAKPAVPFGGCYRIIDFALSNVMHAGLDWVGVLTQYKPLSLMSHIGVGEPWNFYGRQRGTRILPPRTGEAAADWYQGTADAIWQNIDFMESMKPERVLILSGDHIYHMDYRQMLIDHLDRKADVTIAVMEVAPEEVSRFGMIWADSNGNITRFEEKPSKTDTRQASMGIYLFEWPCLMQCLRDIVGKRQGVDFGHDIMPRILDSKRIVAHRFEGYWRDVGTIASFFQANMDALDPLSGLDLDSWEICTRDDSNLFGDRPPVRFGRTSAYHDVLVSGGCQLDGSATRTICSPDVRICRGARVEDSILMHGVTVGPDAVVRQAIVDKGVWIGAGTILDGGDDSVANQEYKKCELHGMVVVGNSVRLPDGIRIGPNVVIEAGTGTKAFRGNIKAGATVRNPNRTPG
jgi:glucose-1-phosphate adenylyltransferase